MKKRTSLLTNTALHVSEAFTQTGPGYREGTNGVSGKPSLPVSLADYPRACPEFLVAFVSPTKVTARSASEASGAKPRLTSGALAVSARYLPRKPAGSPDRNS